MAQETAAGTKSAIQSFVVDLAVLYLIAILVLYPCIGAWSGVVSHHVPEPYLDEYFHEGQARRYLAGKYLEWDPKITTPPGLYVLTILLSCLKRGHEDGMYDLRVINAAVLPGCFILIAGLRLGHGKSKTTTAHWKRIHTAANICFFPPLFFFSALYYTDIASTMSVLLFLRYYLSIDSIKGPSVLQDIFSVLLGLLSLSFRQTNIFWVSVFPAAFTLTRHIRSNILTRNTETIHDPSVEEANVQDYFYTVVSLSTRLVQQSPGFLKGDPFFFSLLRKLTSTIIILFCFAAFVVWNGGVVLGDKSNHVATIHLPQMLYLTVYIAFFSAPLIYPYILSFGLGLLSRLPLPPFLRPTPQMLARQPRLLVMAVCVAISMIIVHYNTIVHPFTLADNRHYTFYVFRLLLRHPAIKYLVTPIYVLAAWAAIQALGSPLSIWSDRTRTPSSMFTRKDTSNKTPQKSGTTVSMVLIWLATSALQLITAPLVEPRYFILPWLVWRLLCSEADESLEGPLINMNNKTAGSDKRDALVWLKETVGFVKQTLVDEHYHRLWLETAWFLTINFVTGWIFINWGFEWPQEPGKVQRFMW